MAIRSKNAVIFAGAGASKAVNKEMFPTTVEFFQQLPKNISKNPLFKFSENFLRDAQKIEIVDIEQILWTLKTLGDFYSSIYDPADVVGLALNQGLTSQIFSGHNDGHLPSIAPQMKTKIDEIISEINKIVYDLYAYEPEISEVEENWVYLLKLISDNYSGFDVFSTNYDANIECAFSFFNSEKDLKKFQGLKGNQRKELDLSRWKDLNSSGSPLLTKLHGSIDWKIQGERIFVGDPVFTGDHSKQGIVYPGFKGNSEINFFSQFHAYLENRLASADLMIVVGFAFRDQHINDIVRENLNSEADVIVINPDDSIQFPRKKHSRLVYIRDYFDQSSVEAAAKVVNWLR